MEFSEGLNYHKVADGKYNDDKEPFKCNADCCDEDPGVRFKEKSKYKLIS